MSQTVSFRRLKPPLTGTRGGGVKSLVIFKTCEWYGAIVNRLTVVDYSRAEKEESKRAEKTTVADCMAGTVNVCTPVDMDIFAYLLLSRLRHTRIDFVSIARVNTVTPTRRVYDKFQTQHVGNWSGLLRVFVGNIIREFAD